MLTNLNLLKFLILLVFASVGKFFDIVEFIVVLSFLLTAFLIWFGNAAAIDTALTSSINSFREQFLHALSLEVQLLERLKFIHTANLMLTSLFLLYAFTLVKFFLFESRTLRAAQLMNFLKLKSLPSYISYWPLVSSFFFPSFLVNFNLLRIKSRTALLK